MTKVLHIDSSAAKTASNSRILSAKLVKKINPEAVTYRDISGGLPIVDEAFINASYAVPEDRTEAQVERLSLSNGLINELRAHDVIVLGVPMYNFNVPASVKLYQDLIARVGETFSYTDSGPKGLLKDKKIYFALTSGGVPLNVGASMDHMSTSLATFFNFIGIEDQEFIVADGLASNAEASLKKAQTDIDNLALS